jgi:hypothetical protein
MKSMQKRVVDIVWTADYHDCETCGGTQADGAVIKIDGKEVADLKPFAHCYDEDSWNSNEVFAILLSKMGIHTVLSNKSNGPRYSSQSREDYTPDPLPEDAPVATITMQRLHDDETHDHSQGYSISIDGTPVIERPPVLLGEGKSPYYTLTGALIALAKHYGAEFTNNSIQSWMREGED